MRRSKHTVDDNSLNTIGTAVAAQRGNTESFGTFQLADSLEVVLNNHEAIGFTPGTIVSFYGSRAVLLATLCNPQYKLVVNKSGVADLFSYKEPSREELLNDRAAFIAWMDAALQLEQ